MRICDDMHTPLVKETSVHPTKLAKIVVRDIKRIVKIVLRPGFEPGSTAREAVILDRTILPELGLVYF